VGGVALSKRIGLASCAAGTAAAVAAAQPASDNSNPLLFSGFPRYADVRAEHVGPAMDARLGQATASLEALERTIDETLGRGQTPSYETLADGTEAIGELVSAPWSTVRHLKGVKDTEALRVAVDTAQPEVVSFGQRMSQSTTLYRGWKALQADTNAWNALTRVQRRVIELEVRGAELAGVALEGAQKERFNEIGKELARLSTSFSNNVLDATKAFSYTMRDAHEVRGLPQSALAMLASTARRRGEEGATAETGPWVATLDFPCMSAILKDADDEALRERIYRAWITRASEQDAHVAAHRVELAHERRRRVEVAGGDRDRLSAALDLTQRRARHRLV